MAEKKIVEDYLTCPVCLETFKEPVSLSCHHSFCYSCLDNYWKNNKKRCPVCRRKFSKDISVNFALKELSLSFSQEPKGASNTGQPHVCSLHPQVTPMFSKEELRLLCPICELSIHTQHTVVSVEEAETELKEHLRTQLQSLKEHRGQVQRLEQVYEQIQAYSLRQVEQCKSHIRAVFTRLQNFLKEQEELSLSVLRQEQHRQVQTIGPELESIREQLSSVDHSIQALEKQLERTRESFLHTYRTPQSHQQASLSPPQPDKGLLINQARVLGNLGFKVWEKMRDIVQYYPVVLDPNTAFPMLRLSEDLTSVRSTDTHTNVPNNPERFSHFALVLGSEGFSSGKHRWDVEVGDHSKWIVGVIKESFKRNQKCYLKPETGLWGLSYYKDEYTNSYDERLKLKKTPLKIHLQLDYNRGKLSFYDSNEMCHIYTYRATFTEKVFPCFYIGQDNKCIRICPSHAHSELW